MSLKGNTKKMPLDELLLFLGEKKSTGTLELVHGAAWKRLYFEKGRIISSGSSEPSEYLGHFLISEDKITEEQLTQALEVQENTKVMIGKILVMIGAVTEQDLLKMLETKCRESVFMMFLWEAADFEFFDEQLPAVRMIPTTMAPDRLVEEGKKRREEWLMLRQAYPSRKIVFAKKESLIEEQSIEDPFRKNLFQLLDGKKTIGDLMMHTHSTENKILRALHQLKEQNLIVIVNYGEEEPPAMLEAFALSQVIENGKNKLAAKRWEEAINLFSYVLQYEENPEAKELLSRAELGLVENIYSSTVSAESIPKLARPLETLSKERLSSEESFLVTRVNGRWDLKSILTITPLREVDALRIMKRLMDRKIIEI